MRNLILLSLLLCYARGWAQDTISFQTPKEMADYAFSATNFNGLPSQFLVNRSMELDPGEYVRFLAGDQTPVTGDNTIGLFSLLQWWSVDQTFNRDSILFPVYEHFSMMDEERELHVPLFITDVNVMKLRPEIWNNFTASTSNAPFPAISQSDVVQQHIETASIFLDSLEYNSVYLDFDASTFVCNTGRTVGVIYLRSGGVEKAVYPGVPLNITDWLADMTIEIEVRFTDGSSFTKYQTIHWKSIMSQRSDMPEFWNTVQREYYDATLPTGIENPEGKFAIWYACEDNKLRKPYLMICGWGVFTDKYLINNNKGFPTPMYKLVAQFNGDGLLEELHSQGFDIVFIQLLPPNASIIKNSVVLEKIINRVNNMKYANGSYEENIIMGVSAGALCARLTLQIMEKKHLDMEGPHPHTKLYISYDGEHKGANVPLGMQHAVKYLYDYEYNNIFTDYITYALHYVLNAPLSKELLWYFHTATGSGDSPGQGADPSRTAYLQYHDWFNHSKNGHLPGYPSFQRNISISNGQSVPSYNYSNYSCDHDPYPNGTGAIFFKQDGSLMGWVNRRYEATFLKHGVHRVFYYEFKPLFKKWRVGYEATTNNPVVLDNASGGIIFIDANPIRQINDELRSELTGFPSLVNDLLFSFTPTIGTHDVRNLNGSIVNGYPDYDFKLNGLMYDNEVAAASGNPLLASDFFGYPHLGYPGSHYDYTPFDAVFTWSQNTEHLLGNRKSDSAYEGVWTEVRPVIKNFIVSESEAWNIMLQNKRVGYYARPDFTYRVDYEALNGIYLGNHVTQKTDFYEMTSEPNAVVEAQAQVEIVFSAGVHLKAGTTFHAFIGDVACEKSAMVNGDGTDEENQTLVPAVSRPTNREMKSEPMVFPNPNKGSFSIAWEEVPEGASVNVLVSDLSGKQLFTTNCFVESEIKHELSKGLYLVSIQYTDSCHSKIIIVE